MLNRAKDRNASQDWTSPCEREKTHIRDTLAFKGNKATLSICRLHHSLRGISPSGNERFVIPNLLQISLRKSSLRNELGKSRFRVLHSHSAKGTPRGDTECNSTLTDGVGDGHDDFENLVRFTVFVWSLAWDVLEVFTCEKIMTQRAEHDQVSRP